MSKIPISRLKNETPPRKGRKALAENNKILNLPTFTKDMNKISSIPRRVNLPLVDPEAVKRKIDNDERSLKLLQVTKDKLNQINIKLKDNQLVLDHLNNEKLKINEDSKNLKNIINNLDIEINLINLEIANSRNNLKKIEEYELKKFRIENNEILIKNKEYFNDLKLKFESEFKKYKEFENNKFNDDFINLENKIKLKLNERNLIYDEINKKLLIKKLEFDNKINELFKFQEDENNKLLLNFESKLNETNQLKQDFNNLNLKLNDLKIGINSTEKLLNIENDIKNNSNLEMNELLKELENLSNKDLEISNKLILISKNYENVKNLNDLSNLKIQKEKNLKRRIQNSIEEINGKLRTYVNIEQNIEVENEIEFDLIKIDEDIFKFNKIFKNEKNNEIINETLTLTENILKNINLSIMVFNFNDELFKDLINSTLNFWKLRINIEKFKPFEFKFTFQIFELKNDKFTNLITNDDVDINNLNESEHQPIQSLENSLNSIKSKNPIFVNLISTKSNDENSIKSTCSFIKLSKDTIIDEEFKEILKNLNNDHKNLLLNHLKSIYKNTKTLSLININANDVKLLKIAQFINSIDSPIKKKRK